MSVILCYSSSFWAARLQNWISGVLEGQLRGEAAAIELCGASGLVFPLQSRLLAIMMAWGLWSRVCLKRILS